MNPTDPDRAPPNVVQLLQAERREYQPVSEAMRSRALQRAQQSMMVPVATMNPSGSYPRHVRLVAPLAIGIIGVAAAAWLYWHANAPREPQVLAATVVDSLNPPSVAPVDSTPQAVTSLPTSALSVTATVHSAAPVPPRVELRVLELTLLESARKATRAGDFATALSVVREHEQRFPRGLLLEEREALRVKSLLGLGRKDEAFRAAESFRKRFPQSVLLPSVRRMVGAAE